MRWTVHGERPIYESEWVGLHLVDIELPDGERFEHHVVRTPSDASGTVVVDDERGVLMLWRHRFITDTWGWEIPAGRIDPGEEPAEAATREVLEETGWRPLAIEPLGHYFPSNGLSDQTFHLFLARGAAHVGDPVDAFEAERVEWLPIAEVHRLVVDHAVLDGLSLTALTWAFTAGRLPIPEIWKS